MKRFLLTILITICSLLSFAGEYANFTISQKNNKLTLVFTAKINDGFHLYSPYNPKNASQPMEITLLESDSYKQKGKIKEISKAKEEYVDIFDVTEKFFEKEAIFEIDLESQSENDFYVEGTISYQVCNTEFFCAMEHQDFKILVKVPKAKEEKKVKEEKTKEQTENKAITQKNDSVIIAKTDTAKIKNQNKDTLYNIAQNPSKQENTPIEENNDSFAKIFFLAFLAGLLAIFTPCVFPMIPMTVSFFIKQKSKGKFLAILYGIFIILLYTIPIILLIIISNLSGGSKLTADIFNALSTHWLPNILFFIIFMIFAISFLGAFNIELPSKLVNKADKNSYKGGLIGIFFMAFVLVLVSFSCTGPIVGTVLVQSMTSQNYLNPIISMLGFSIAFSLPFVLFALFPNLIKKMPKSGSWLNKIKVVLGFVELALGLKFLSIVDQTYHWHILDREIFLAIWIVISCLLGFYLLGKIKLAHDQENENKTSILGLMLAIICFSFAIYMLPGMFGAPLKALSGYIPPITTQDFVIGQNSNNQSINTKNNDCYQDALFSDFLKLPYNIPSYFEINQAINSSKKQGKPMLLIFTGHGCANCRKMEENLWQDYRVQDKMKNDFVVCALYVDDKTEINGEQIGKTNSMIQIEKFGINAQPYYVIVDGNNPFEPIKKPMAYNTNIDEFLDFLSIK